MRNFLVILLAMASTGFFSKLANAQHPIPKGNANWAEAGEFIFLENEVMDVPRWC